MAIHDDACCSAERARLVGVDSRGGNLAVELQGDRFGRRNFNMASLKALDKGAPKGLAFFIEDATE